MRLNFFRRFFRPARGARFTLTGLLAITALAGLPASAAAGDHVWTPLVGTGLFRGFAADPFDRTLLYAVSGFAAEVYRSTDSGHTWSWAHTGLGPSAVSVLEADPTRAGRLYAATAAGDFYRSNDRGASWVRLSALGETFASRLTIVPRGTKPPALFLSGYTWIRRSLDGGASWRVVLRVSATGQSIAGGVAADPALPNRLFTSNGQRILRSDDLGLTWTAQPAVHFRPEFGAGEVRLGGVAPFSPSVVFAFSQGAIHRSLDGGRTWRRTLLPDARQTGSAFAVDGNRLWAGFDSLAQVMLSQDAGASWRVMRDTNNSQIQQIRVQPARREVYALGLNSGVERWVAGNWERLATTGFLDFTVPTFVRGTNPRLVYQGIEVNVSFDGGSTFFPLAPTRPPGINVYGFHVETDPARVALRLTATGSGVYRSLDGGASWTLLGSVPRPAGLPTPALGFPFPTPQLAFVSGETVLAYYPCGLARSTDGGGTWTEVLPCVLDPGSTSPFDDLRQRVLEVVVSPLEARTIFLRTQENRSPAVERLLRSTDGGVTFAPVLFGRTALRFAPSDPSRLYLVQESGLWRSSDGGLTFVQVAPLGFTQGLNDLQVDPHDAQTIYAAVAGQGVKRSRDGGTTWTDISTGLAAYLRLDISSMAVNPTNTTLYANPSRGGTFAGHFE